MRDEPESTPAERAQGARARLSVLQNLVRRLSRATSAQDAFFGFVGRLWQVYPIDLMLGVHVEGLEPGAYRISYQLPVELLQAGRWGEVAALCPRDPMSAPVRRGGWLSGLVLSSQAALIPDIDLARDPVLGGIAGAMRSAVAVPVYTRGRVSGWSVALSRRAGAFTASDVEDALVTANLLSAHNDQLDLAQEVQRLNDALTRQMDEVAQIQRALLPQGPPDVPGLDILARCRGTPYLSGDYYDFFPHPDGQVGLFIADVSGKGAGAATVMAMLRSMLHAFAGSDRRPSHLLAYANHELLDSRMPIGFVTAIYAAVDPRTGEIEYASAGHPPPIVAGARARLLEGHACPPLGIVRDLSACDQRERLAPGESLVLVTDGVPEAFDAQQEMLGMHGVREALAGASPSAAAVLERLERRLDEHSGPQAPRDDQTMIACTYRGSPRTPSPTENA